MLCMNLPKLEKVQRYQGLYVIDFGDHTGVGFTADEVAELLESRNAPVDKIYKIYRAYPDGRLELKGVPAQTFQLESGMFFYCQDEAEARDAYRRLIALAVAQQPPCRAKVHLSRWSQDQYVVGLIYPAEYNDDISDWLLAGRYASTGLAEGGRLAVVVSESGVRRARVYTRAGGKTAWRSPFDSSAPILAGFERAVVFRL